MLEREIHRQLKDHTGYKAIQAIPRVGPTIVAIMVAEIGDISRFANPQALCSWAGLTPKHHESDTKVRRGGHQAGVEAGAVRSHPGATVW